MKKIIAYILPLMILMVSCFGFNRVVYSHGVIYEQEKVGENTLRVTVKWSDPNDKRGIVITSYAPMEGKYIDIGYEIKDGAPNISYKDFDLRSLLPPLCIKLYNIKDYDKPAFPDLKEHYSEGYVHHLHDGAIINGRPDGSFGPNANISRAEFATIMVKALGLNGQADNSMGFKDINNHWAKQNILIAAKNGLIKGNNDNTVRPDNPITVAEASAIVSRSFIFNTLDNGIYPKLAQNKWYSSDVKKLFDAKILKIADNIYGAFNEEKYINRADSAMMISRALTEGRAKNK